VFEAPWVRAVKARAEAAADIPLEALVCGRAEARARTEVAQPVLLFMEWLAWEALTRQGIPVKTVAGHSLGEYAALAAAEVFDWDTAVALVTLRGKLMQQAADARPGGMVAVLGLDAAQVERLARDEGCHVANRNAPFQTVVAGEAANLARLDEAATRRGGKAIRLTVSGAFHSPMMGMAAQQMATRIQKIPFAVPRTPVISGVSGRVEPSPGRLKDLLCAQMTSPVLWSAVVEQLASLGVSEAVETGPGQVLTKLGRGQCEKVAFRTFEEMWEACGR